MMDPDRDGEISREEFRNKLMEMEMVQQALSPQKELDLTVVLDGPPTLDVDGSNSNNGDD
jgi:hypothetical protein